MNQTGARPFTLTAAFLLLANLVFCGSLAAQGGAAAPAGSTGAAVETTPGPKEIRIGMSGAFSGASAELGRELVTGMSAYFEQLNRDSGIHGRPVRLVSYDDGYNPDPAIRNTLTLINDDQVMALAGYVGTPTVTRVLPVLELFQEQHIYLFFPFTGAETQRLPPYNRFAFNLRASYAQETAGLVDHLVAAGHRRIAVFYQVDAYGRSGWMGLRTALQRHELAIAGEATYLRGARVSEDYAAQVERLRDSGATAVISIAAYEAAAGFIRDARNAGWQVPIANVSFVNSESLLQLLQQAGEETGADYTSNLINSEVVPNYRDSDLPAVREYRELVAGPIGQKLSARPGFVGLEGYLNARLLAEVFRRMGDELDNSRIPAIMNSLGDYDLGIEQRLEFSAENNQGLSQVYFNTVSGGQYMTIQDWRAWVHDVETL